MARLKSGLTLVTMVAAAFLGGAFAQWMMNGSAVHAQVNEEMAPETDTEAQPQPGMAPGMAPETTPGAELEEVEIHATAFVLVNANGVEVGRIEAGAGGAEMVLCDNRGRERLVAGNLRTALAPEASAWGLTVRDATGRDRAAIGLADNAGIGIWDPRGELRIGIGESERGVGMAIMDPAGETRAAVNMPPNAPADFTLSDPEGKTLWSATQSAQKTEVVRARGFMLVDGLGQDRGGLSVALEGPQLVLKDEEGAQRVVLGSTATPADAPTTQWNLAFTDRGGAERLRVGALKDGSGWGLGANDDAGLNRITVGLWEDAASGLRIFDTSGVRRIGLGLTLDGRSSGLTLADVNGIDRLGVNMGPAGAGDFVMKDWEGRDTWRASRGTQPPPPPR